MTRYSRLDRGAVGELVIRVYDRGTEPDWHTDRSLFGPWCRFEAELIGREGATALGMSPWDAIHRLLAGQRHELDGLKGDRDAAASGMASAAARDRCAT